jgi:hypothetical protein
MLRCIEGSNHDAKIAWPKKCQDSSNSLGPELSKSWCSNYTAVGLLLLGGLSTESGKLSSADNDSSGLPLALLGLLRELDERLHMQQKPVKKCQAVISQDLTENGAAFAKQHTRIVCSS